MIRRPSRVLAVLLAVLLGATLAGCRQPAPERAGGHSLTGYWQNFDNGATNVRLGDVPAAYDIVAVGSQTL